MKLYRTFLFLGLSTLILTACGGESTDTNENNLGAEGAAASDEQPNLDEEAQFRMDMIISNNIAAPAKLLTNMKEAGMNEYVPELLVKADNVVNGMTNHVNKALLLGVVGSDVSYIAMHDRHNEALPYLAVMKKLGDDLGCGYVMDEEMLNQFEGSKGDKDKLIAMVYDQYYKFDDYLRTNDRIETAAHVLTGGLVESLYQVTSQINPASITDNAKLILYDERNSLGKVIELYSDLKQTAGNDEIVKHLKAISEAFGAASEFTPAALKELSAVINELRQHFIEGSIS